MKTHFLFLILMVGISCASLNKAEKCPTLVRALEETFKDDFFNQYKDENGKLNIITEFNDVYQEINQCEKSLSFILDSVNRGQSKYLSINDYVKTTERVRLQIGCYKTNEEPYFILYSTSFKIKDNSKLIIDGEPFIDTVQVKR